MPVTRRSVNGGLDGAARKYDNPPSLKVGFLEGAKYADGTSVPMVAAINEFGAPSRGQPPRPYFRNMIATEKKVMGRKFSAAVKATKDIEKSMDLLGQDLEAALKQSIMELTEPPLAPSTIRRKGHDKPLINTGHMRDSVSYEVVKK